MKLKILNLVTKSLAKNDIERTSCLKFNEWQYSKTNESNDYYPMVEVLGYPEEKKGATEVDQIALNNLE